MGFRWRATEAAAAADGHPTGDWYAAYMMYIIISWLRIEPAQAQLKTGAAGSKAAFADCLNNADCQCTHPRVHMRI